MRKVLTTRYGFKESANTVHGQYDSTVASSYSVTSDPRLQILKDNDLQTKNVVSYELSVQAGASSRLTVVYNVIP